jgi:precorrin-3B C17-methyltransferase
MRSSSNLGIKAWETDRSQNKEQKRNSGNCPGELKVVGIGPGSPDYLCAQAREAVLEAEVVVGYKGYIALLQPDFLQGKLVISTGMKGEIERCWKAIDAAIEGKNTVVVSSGDPGIYGMAGLVLELLEERNLTAQIDLEVIPGIPALSAGAALLGAPLMHDFAVISLSDLMTPFEIIEQRVRAAATSDFVLVLYNPRSRSRSWQLGRALDIIREYRSGSTPVGIARNVSRTNEQITITTVSQIDCAEVDMGSTVIIGNSRTRLIGGKMVTPRGYLERYDIEKLQEGRKK